MIDLGEKIGKIFENLIKSLTDSFSAPFKDLPTLKNLVFGKFNDDLIWSTFHEKDLTKAFSPIFNTMTSVAGFALVIFIVFAGIRITSSSLMATRRNEIFESAKDLIFVVLLLFNLPTLYDVLFAINDDFIKLFSAAYKSDLDELKAEDETAGIIGNIFIQLILLGLAVWANFFYMMRRITLLILMGIGPVMVVCLMFPRWKSIASTWFKELTGTIYVQTIHAFVFWVISITSSTANSFVESTIVFLIFIPITVLMRRLLGMGGDMNQSLATAGSMMGLTALGGMAGAIKGAFSDKSVMGALKGMANGVKKGKDGKEEEGDVSDASKTMAASAGSDIGSTTRAERMLRAGDIVSKMGRATLGAAGAIAGSATGPVGTMVGAQGASMVGNGLGALVGRSGAALSMKLADRFKKGKNALSDLNESREKDFDDSVSDLMAENATNQWATDNKEAIMSDLKQKFPDATQKELDDKFEEIKADKKEALLGEAKGQWNDAKGMGKKVARGASLVNASADAMAQQWGENNQEAFFDEYDKSNPQKPGESDAQYLARRMNAFNSKVGSVRDQFAKAGQDYVAQFGAGDNPVSRVGFNQHMAKALKGFTNMGDMSGLEEKSIAAVSNVESEKMFTSSGVPNASFIANSLAHAKTMKMGQDFIKQQVSSGVTLADAKGNWASQEANIHSQNLAQYSASDFQDAVSSLRQVTMPQGKIQRIAQSAGVATSAALGLPEMKQAMGRLNAGTVMGMTALASNEGFLKAIPGSINAAIQGVANQRIADNGGNAVQTEANFVNSAGMNAGMLFGVKGYQAAKKFALKHSPYKYQTESQIASPSETIQMAQTVTDDFGNTRIAPGAIRQVVTRDASYVEVLTKGGERRVISRLAAGHSGMQKGDVVYQDLDVDNDMLIPIRSNGSRGNGTYRLDSGGAKIPSSVSIQKDANQILGNPLRSSAHAPIARNHTQAFNQQVDAGKFFIEDIENLGMNQLQVVVDKGRQYVTAEKDGKTYRVSPVFSGDTRMDLNSSISIPVTVENNRLTANSNALNSVTGEINVSDSSSPIDYYSSKGVDGLILSEFISSKHTQHAQKSCQKRAILDEVRRRQGIIG